jgi:hypothetical protein
VKRERLQAWVRKHFHSPEDDDDHAETLPEGRGASTVGATLERWLPLARGLAGAAIGVSLATAWSRGDWLSVGLNALLLVALYVPMVREVRKGSTSRCSVCGKRAAWLYSVIPPPKTPAGRLMDRHLGTWAVWSACEDHFEKMNDTLEVIINDAREEHRGHNHPMPRLYGLAARSR